MKELSYQIVISLLLMCNKIGQKVCCHKCERMRVNVILLVVMNSEEFLKYV